MTRYFFDIYNENHAVVDEEGMDLPDIAAAQLEAAQSLAELMRDETREPSQSLSRMSIEVRDDRGPLLQVRYMVEFSRRQ